MEYKPKSLADRLAYSSIAIGFGVSLYGLTQFTYPYHPLLNKIEQVRIEARNGIESVVHQKLPDSESSHNRAPDILVDLGIIIAVAPEVLIKRKN